MFFDQKLFVRLVQRTVGSWSATTDANLFTQVLHQCRISNFTETQYNSNSTVFSCLNLLEPPRFGIDTIRKEACWASAAFLNARTWQNVTIFCHSSVAKKSNF